MFVQGSPNLNTTFTNTDLYIDNKLAFCSFFYPYSVPNPFPSPACPVVVGPATPFIVLPVGIHDFKLVESGTTNTTFLDAQIKLTSGQKIMLVAEGDAAYHTTQWAEWLLPTYTTPAGIRATSTFNATPNGGAADFWYNCNAPALCGDGTHSGTALATGLTVGSAAAPITSWKNNVLLKASTTGNYCFAAYTAGGAGPPLPFVNAAAGPPFAGEPVPFAATEDPRNAACATQFEVVAPGSDTNFVIIDAPSVAPKLPPHGPSAVVQVPDSNG